MGPIETLFCIGQKEERSTIGTTKRGPDETGALVDVDGSFPD